MDPHWDESQFGFIKFYKADHWYPADRVWQDLKREIGEEAADRSIDFWMTLFPEL